MTMEKRILICIEAVGMEDRAYGFFIEWLSELERQGVGATVLCLRKGDIPDYAAHRIIELPRSGRGLPFRRALALWRISWEERDAYQSVFVRQAPIFVLVAGLLWKLLGKRVVLWYAHYTGNRVLPAAALLSDAVVTSVPEACRLRVKRPIPIGQAVNTDRFRIPDGKPFDGFRTLILCRVSRVKRVAEMAHAFMGSVLAQKGNLEVVGAPLDPDESVALESKIAEAANIQWDKAGIAHAALPEFLSGFDFMMNFYQGSLDKTILEGMACGIIPFVATDAAEDILPEDLHWLITRTADDFHRAVIRALELTPAARAEIGNRLRDIVVQKHSLSGQIANLLRIAFPEYE